MSSDYYDFSDCYVRQFANHHVIIRDKESQFYFHASFRHTMTEDDICNLVYEFRHLMKGITNENEINDPDQDQ